MLKAIIITLIGIPCLAIFWPAGLIMIIWGIVSILKIGIQYGKRYLDDVHTIAQHTKEE